MFQSDVKTFGLFLNPSPVLVNISCIDDQEVAVCSHLIDQQVVHYTAIFVAHHAIENLSGIHLGDVVRKDMVDVTLGIGTTYQDLAHVTDVKDATSLTYGLMLVDDARILDGHVETSER